MGDVVKQYHEEIKSSGTSLRKTLTPRMREVLCQGWNLQLHSTFRDPAMKMKVHGQQIMNLLGVSAHGSRTVKQFGQQRVPKNEALKVSPVGQIRANPHKHHDHT